MGRTACTEPQSLYKGALYFYIYIQRVSYKTYYFFLIICGLFTEDVGSFAYSTEFFQRPLNGKVEKSVRKRTQINLRKAK
jgi:hypothetical protein